MILCFELTMPRNNSWNGRWSGEDRRYFIFKTVSTQKAIAKATKIIANSGYWYDFGDGWAAEVDVRAIDSATKKKLSKINAGFCGYNWMVESIMNYGKIYAGHQTPEVQSFLLKEIKT